MHQLLFYLPIAFGALLAGGAALGLLELGPDADLDMDVDADLDAEAEADAEGDAEGGLAATALSALGVGKAPLGVLLMSACFLFGLSGLAADLVLELLLGESAAWLPLSAIVATAAALFGTGATGRAFGRLVPTRETYASRKTDLLGREGRALLPTDARYGVATVLDAGGAHLRVRCRTLDTDPPLAAGEALVVADYDEDDDTYLVTRLPS
ncbi:MAG: hypothetical protein AAGH15_28115 [Myxococcota bacterium]